MNLRSNINNISYAVCGVCTRGSDETIMGSQNLVVSKLGVKSPMCDRGVSGVSCVERGFEYEAREPL